MKTKGKKPRYAPLTSPLAWKVFSYLLEEDETDYYGLMNELNTSRVVLVDLVSEMKKAGLVCVKKKAGNRRVGIKIDFPHFTKMFEEYFSFFIDEQRAYEKTEVRPAQHGVKVFFPEVDAFFKLPVSISIIRILAKRAEYSPAQSILTFIGEIFVELSKFELKPSAKGSGKEYLAVKNFSDFLKKHREKYEPSVQDEIDCFLKDYFKQA